MKVLPRRFKTLPPSYRSPSNPQPSPTWKRVLWEIGLVGGVYGVTYVVGRYFWVSLCGPGCEFVVFTALVVVSALLMLRRAFLTRLGCCIVLMFSLRGMWKEKEIRATWGEETLRHQVEALQETLENREKREKRDGA